jgi:hypothetical protein
MWPPRQDGSHECQPNDFIIWQPWQSSPVLSKATTPGRADNEEYGVEAVANQAETSCDDAANHASPCEALACPIHLTFADLPQITASHCPSNWSEDNTAAKNNQAENTEHQYRRTPVRLTVQTPSPPTARVIVIVIVIVVTRGRPAALLLGFVTIPIVTPVTRSRLES